MKTIALFFILLATVVSGQVIHVPAQYGTIQQAVDVAQPGDTVLIDDGTYYEHVLISGKRNLTIASRFITEFDSVHLYNTILDGRSYNNQYGSVIRLMNTDTTTVISGLTITGGNGTPDPVSHTLCGGAVFIDSCGVKLTHNRIVGNHIKADEDYSAEGAGVFSRIPCNKWVIITDNFISGNSCTGNLASGAGGVIPQNLKLLRNVIINNHCRGTLAAIGGGFFATGDTLIASCNLITANLAESDNYAEGAGLMSFSARGLVYGNEFSENESQSSISSSGALAVWYTSHTMVKRNLFSNNKAEYGSALNVNLNHSGSLSGENNIFKENEAITGGAIFITNGYTSLVNNVFTQNCASESGGVLYMEKRGKPGSVEESPSRIVNNTFRANRAGSGGGAVTIAGLNPVLLNDIFWNNNSPESPDLHVASGSASIAYCNIDTTAIHGKTMYLKGIRNYNPMFNEYGCCISLTSPCADAGVPVFVFPDKLTVYAPGKDITGMHQRPLGKGLDLGAFEASAEDKRFQWSNCLNE